MLASKLRKEFKKQFDLSLGDLIQAEGRIGSFRGISTYSNPSEIRVELQGTDSKKTDIKTLPEYMLYGHKEIPIRYALTTPTEFPQHL